MGASNSNAAAQEAAAAAAHEEQERARAQKEQALAQKIAEETTKPLILNYPRSDYGNQGGGRSRVQHRFLFWEPTRINGLIIVKAFGCFIVPPFIFGWCMSCLSFTLHFRFPKLIWILSSSLPIVILLMSITLTVNAFRVRREPRWAVSGLILCSVAFAAGTLLGDINYLVNLHDYYFLDSLKSYSNIKPGAVSGGAIMDAGRVRFSENMKIMGDLGMSFTMWDTYCVAPLSMEASASSTSSSSSSTYDIWIVGKNCCSASRPEFACGEYQNPKAKAGLRQTNMPERYFFNLAVQQAEAAYDIQAKHPIFFTLTTDPDKLAIAYFAHGFRVWLTCIFFHFAINTFIVCFLMNTFKHPTADLFLP